MLSNTHLGTTLPVNPLTGDILGNRGQKTQETPRKEYNPGMFKPNHHNWTIFPFKKIFLLEGGQLLSGEWNSSIVLEVNCLRTLSFIFFIQIGFNKRIVWGCPIVTLLTNWNLFKLVNINVKSKPEFLEQFQMQIN